MSIAIDIIQGKMPNFMAYLQAGESLDDIDEFGFTPLIESILARNIDVTRALLAQKVIVDKPDMAGRTALQWAVDNDDIVAATLLLDHGADANASTKQGFSALVYPVLRGQMGFKQLL